MSCEFQYTFNNFNIPSAQTMYFEISEVYWNFWCRFTEISVQVYWNSSILKLWFYIEISGGGILKFDKGILKLLMEVYWNLMQAYWNFWWKYIEIIEFWYIEISEGKVYWNSGWYIEIFDGGILKFLMEIIYWNFRCRYIEILVDVYLNFWCKYIEISETCILKLW